MKTFTLDEAQSLLPVLESLLKRALESKKAAELVEADLLQCLRYLTSTIIDAVGLADKSYHNVPVRSLVQDHLGMAGGDDL